MTITRELGYSDLAVKILESKSNNDPTDQKSALELFDAYVAANDFMKMNATSMKISNTFGLPKYKVHNVQSLYMLSQSETAPPNMIDLAYMFAKKLIDEHGEGNIPPSEGKLYAKILAAKGMYNEALDFVQNTQGLFAITNEDKVTAEDSKEEIPADNEFEKSRKIIEIMTEQATKDSSGENQAKLVTQVYKMISDNYKNPAEFKSIYDLYLLLIDTLTTMVHDQIQGQKLTDIYKEVQDSEAKDNDGKSVWVHNFTILELTNGDGSYTIDSLKTLWVNLRVFQDFELDTNKTSEAHNLRKASILSQLYLAYKLLKHGAIYDQSSINSIFHDISLTYAKR